MASGKCRRTLNQRDAYLVALRLYRNKKSAKSSQRNLLHSSQNTPRECPQRIICLFIIYLYTYKQKHKYIIYFYIVVQCGSRKISQSQILFIFFCIHSVKQTRIWVLYIFICICKWWLEMTRLDDTMYSKYNHPSEIVYSHWND